jgi:hypothetical protein
MREDEAPDNLIRPVFDAGSQSVKQQIVETLEAYLDMAKRGEVSAFVAAARVGAPDDLSGGDIVRTIILNNGNKIEQLGLVELLRNSVLQNI